MTDFEVNQPPRIPNNCYDFPLAVIHTPICPRYKGGVCHPLPTPVEPMTDEERDATALYEQMVAVSSHTDHLDPHEVIRRMGQNAIGIEATGTTGSIRKVVH